MHEDFPPHLPSGWEQAAPFAIHKSVPGGRYAKIVGAVQSWTAPISYLVEVGSYRGRTHIDPNGRLHVGVPPFKNPDPPFIEDFGAAVELAESYLDHLITVGPIVEHPPR